MNITHQDIGKWYLIEYGITLRKAQLIRVCQTSSLLAMKTKCGFPWRITIPVSRSDILQEVEDPRWIAKIKRLLQKI